MESETCNVCVEKYSDNLRKKVTCNYCNYTSCVSCTQKYLLSGIVDAHCMNCRTGWNREFLDINMKKSFRTGAWREHKKTLILNREKALLPTMQRYAAAKKSMDEMMPLYRQKNTVVEEIRKEIKKNDIDLFLIKSKIINNKNYNKSEEEIDLLLATKNKNSDRLFKEEINYTIINDNYIHNYNIYNDITHGITESKQFILKCVKEGCRGFLSSAYKCELCSTYVCKDCMVIKSDKNDEDHVCKKEDVDTVAMIRKDTHPCPKCGIRISKVDGCFAKDTPILLYNGEIKMSQDIKIGDILIGDDETSRNVEQLCSGEDDLYEIKQGKGISYIVNSKHKLALKFSGDKTIYWSSSENAWKMVWFDNDTKRMKHKKVEVNNSVTKDDALKLIEAFKQTLNTPDIIEMIVDDYLNLSKSNKTSLMGFKSDGGEKLYEIPTLIARKKCNASQPNKDYLRTNISVKHIGKGNYYGWSISGNKRFLLSDFTVVRNCDQMFCVNDGCNVAFSWSSGKIISGVIHNPHYYEWVRRNNAGAEVTVNPIACNEIVGYTQLFIAMNAVIMDNLNKNMISYIHRCLSDIEHGRLPSFPDTRNPLMFKELHCEFLLNIIDETSWRQSMFLKENNFEKKQSIGLVLRTFVTVCNDNFTKFYQELLLLRNNTSIPVKSKVSNKLAVKFIKESNALREYINKNLVKTGITMMCAVPQITKDWLWQGIRKVEYILENDKEISV